jgi:hypothetical protein
MTLAKIPPADPQRRWPTGQGLIHYRHKHAEQSFCGFCALETDWRRNRHKTNISYLLDPRTCVCSKETHCPCPAACLPSTAMFHPAEPSSGSTQSREAMSSFHAYAKIGHHARWHIQNGEYQAAAHLYSTLIQIVKEDLIAIESHPSNHHDCESTLLRVKLPPRRAKHDRAGLMVPFNALELCDCFFAFEIVEDYGQLSDSDIAGDELLQDDEESLVVIASLALYNLAMTLLWSDVIASPRQPADTALRPPSMQAKRALQIFQRLGLLPLQSQWLYDQKGYGDHFNSATQFHRLKASLLLAAINNSAYIYSVWYNDEALHTCLAQMNDVMSASSFQSASAKVEESCDCIPPDNHGHYRVVNQVCMLNLFFLFYALSAGAPMA